ncbi:hypothetical protein Ahy_B07g087396 [Arachis hypogaea]|uniref:Protein FAR1-RELATED SEQUENCE n=1 Tax=Arachis hypogaea TaxID=3818 RepID=A0A444YC14_ARAHY|nr:hypothetical protein Ahy_B07g087396 [Arachis hypogaea]
MSVRRTIENNEEAGIRPSKTNQSFVAAVGGHRELNFIEKDNFFSELELDDDQSIKLAFWADARSRAAFEYFRDVISFDMTYNTNSKDSFDRNWNDFLLKYGLVDNKWLSDLYEDRHIWVPIYLDHHFWAGMRSTQRSESMHSFFNKFITRNSSLIQFVKQYDNCLGSREQAERESDAADFHTVIPCATKSSIEA